MVTPTSSDAGSPSAITISVLAGASETMRLGAAAIVTERVASSVTLTGNVAAAALAEAAGPAAGGADCRVVHPAVAIPARARTPARAASVM